MCELLSHVWLHATPWTVACQAPLSMEFSRQEYWSGLQIPTPGDLSHPGTEFRSPALQADSLLSELQGKSVSSEITNPTPFILSVNYKLALTKSIANDWTTKAFAICLYRDWTPCHYSCWSSTPPREFRVEGGTLCSRESGGMGLYLVGCF